VEDIVDGVKIRRFENRWRAKDGRYHWISWDCTCLTEDGVYYASGWDVSAEKRQARQRERHLEFEQQLIGIVSHDLRNPIAAIALTAEALMRKKDVAATLERPLQRITHSAKRAERMIFDLLDFTQARLGTGLIMHRSRVDIGEVAGRCLDDLQVVHPSRQLTLVVNGDPVIDADGDRLAQVITNLAGNGLKYSPHDAPVTVTLTHTPDAFTLEVHNEGDPINPSELPYIFKPLRRGSRLGQTERNIGLGLYIVKEIVKAHGGTIAVTSDLLHGTTFKVCLPQSVPSGKALPRPSAARV
jgi:signal transduction histidine kinase